jgi:hypothetical protein
MLRRLQLLNCVMWALLLLIGVVCGVLAWRSEGLDVRLAFTAVMLVLVGIALK